MSLLRTFESETPRAACPGTVSITNPKGAMMMNDLILVCDDCERAIADDELGYLWVNRDAVSRVERAVAEWEAKYERPSGENRRFISSVAVREYPARVRWQTHHAACDPDPDAWAYDIDGKDLRTYGQLLGRTADLMGKPWLRFTDWPEVLRGVHSGKSRLIVAP